ncbi:MAG: pyridoxamine 5'-phosphate oxidase [Candidatus Latescibacterota bacterium]|jgi:pyridoxamine 5'-phosphate oxidase
MPEFVIPDADPMDELRRWLAEAAEAGISNPAAMVLATVSPDGRPSARAVMVGTRDPDTLTFFSHYESPKGRDMDDNPAVEGVFLWTPLERQVRVSGTVARVTAAESDAYWSSRPRTAQLAIAATTQSLAIEDYPSLARRKADLAARTGEGEIPRPESYGGYRLTPQSMEFWQGRPEDRLHLRALYQRQAGEDWSFGYMAP